MAYDMRTLITLVEATQKPFASSKTIVAIWHMMNQKFGRTLDAGRSRAVWGNDRYVFKVPLNANGVRDNLREAELYRDRANQPHPLARCKLIYIRNVPILVMEHVTEMPFRDKPHWASKFDKFQVGRNRAGDVVAYDYANPD